jgi:hypothetical protein
MRKSGWRMGDRAIKRKETAACETFELFLVSVDTLSSKAPGLRRHVGFEEKLKGLRRVVFV